MTRLLCTMACVGCFGASLFGADGIGGTWVSGSGPTAKTYVFKVQGDRFIGAVCGPCDDPSTVFRISDGRMLDPDHATFSIVREEAGYRDTVTAALSAAPSPAGLVLKRVVGGDEPGAKRMVATVTSEALPGGRAAPSPTAGRWVAAGRVAQQNVTLKIRDRNKVWGFICGPCSNPDGVFLIEDGMLEGDAVSFFIHHIDTPAASIGQNGPGRNFMKGVISDNVMRFKWVREGKENEPGGEMLLIGPIR